MNDLERKILAEIEQRRLTPKSALYFLARRSALWLLAALSLLLGGISVALGLYAMEDFALTGGRGFSDMPFDDVLVSLPFLWAVAVALLAASAVFSLRQTRRGYRPRLASLLGIVLGANLLAGWALHATGAGRHAHAVLSAYAPGYAAYTAVPYDEWSRPDQGYLGGAVLSVDGAGSLRLKAFDGQEWTIDISAAKLSEGLEGSLVEEGDIAVTGTRSGPATFRADAIAPFD